MDTDDIYTGNLDSNLDLYTQQSDIVHTYNGGGSDDMIEHDEMNGSKREDDEGISDDELDGEEIGVVDDDLTILRHAWINERGAPEILMYEGAALENLMELVDFQIQKNTGQSVQVQSILNMDIERVKFLVRSYLRTRLYKIEKHAKFYVDSPEHSERLSQNELEYAKGFIQLEDKHLRNSFLNQLPPHLQRLDEVGAEGLEMITKPDMDSAVFCRVRTNIGEFQFEQGEDAIEMRRNNIFITRYSIIRNLLDDGKVELL